jgi:uncharacterized protein (TIGR00730 family)
MHFMNAARVEANRDDPGGGVIRGGSMSSGKNDKVASGRTVSLADQDGVKAVIESTVLGLWEIVNNLTRLRPSKHDRYRVTIFGSARAREGTFVYEETRRLARSLTELGCDIVTGGGPGLMRAANEGAAEAAAAAHERSVGIRIDLPFEQQGNAFVTQMYSHRTFFTRLHHFVLASDAFIVTPGGIGTVLEATMVWQLLQVGHLADTPLVLVGRMWSGFVEWARAAMLDARLEMVSREDLAIPRCVATAGEAIEVIRAAHQDWLRR